MLINLILAALQPLSAGLSMSGYGGAVTVHVAGALALQLGALVQAAVAVVLWRRRHLAGAVAGFSVALVLLAFLELAAGRSRMFWLHLPLGVAIFGGLLRHVIALSSFKSHEPIRIP